MGKREKLNVQYYKVFKVRQTLNAPQVEINKLSKLIKIRKKYVDKYPIQT